MKPARSHLRASSRALGATERFKSTPSKWPLAFGSLVWLRNNIVAQPSDQSFFRFAPAREPPPSSRQPLGRSGRRSMIIMQQRSRQQHYQLANGSSRHRRQGRQADWEYHKDVSIFESGLLDWLVAAIWHSSRQMMMMSRPIKRALKGIRFVSWRRASPKVGPAEQRKRLGGVEMSRPQVGQRGRVALGRPERLPVDSLDCCASRAGQKDSLAAPGGDTISGPGRPNRSRVATSGLEPLVARPPLVARLESRAESGRSGRRPLVARPCTQSIRLRARHAQRGARAAAQ